MVRQGELHEGGSLSKNKNRTRDSNSCCGDACFVLFWCDALLKREEELWMWVVGVVGRRGEWWEDVGM